MKNMNKITGLLRTSALCLTLAAMAACDAEDFTRTAGDIPGKDDLANVGGVLRREKTPDQISALKLSEEQTTTDAVFYQLTQPAAADVTVTVDADATLVDEYNKDKQGDAKLTLFPLGTVRIIILTLFISLLMTVRNSRLTGRFTIRRYSFRAVLSGGFARCVCWR